eukprot:TRINITY_DN78_c0_g2_i1.p1 TRINITY_DN78_c0_g2~~TRINITY_DN78_c0_g2_i1.p1  ORF type:complete len:212 (+),score=-13.31 TRINITY_DN78_c0_g2_i1:435-1070(+)
MLSQLILFRKSKNFTSDNEIGTPPIVSIDHYLGPADRRTDRGPIVSSHADICRAHACFKHSNLLKVTPYSARSGQLSPEACPVQKIRHEHRFTPSKGGPVFAPKVRLRAFQPQQLKYTLLELELPRLLAPDLPSNRSSVRCLKCSHSNYQTFKAQHCYLLSLPHSVCIGQFSRLLPSLDVVAVSQAPSPESNPNPPSPVKIMVRHYRTIVN